MEDQTKIPIRTYYISIICMSLLGIGVSLFLIPSESTLAHIRTQGQRFKEAQPYYEKEYKNGVRSPDLLYRLSQLELKRGNTENAIQYAEELVNQYPNNLHALQYLRKLYYSNLKYDNYYKTLKKEQSLERQGSQEGMEHLQALATWYKTQNRYKEQAEVLQQIIATQRGTAENYNDLAFYLAQNKHYGQAKRLMEERNQLFPDSVQLENLYFIVWLSFKEPEAKENPQLAISRSVELLYDYLYEYDKPEFTESALDFVSSNYPSWAPIFIKKIFPLTEDDPALELTAIESLWYTATQLDDKKLALTKLDALYQHDLSNSNVQKSYFSMLQESKDTQLLSNFFKKGDLTKLGTENIQDFANWALENKQCDLANEMLRNMPSDYLEKNLAIQVPLLIAACSCSAEAKLDRLLKEKLSTSQLMYLFRMALAANMECGVLKIGCLLSPYTTLNKEELAEVTFGYIEVHQGREFREYLTQISKKIKQEALDAAFALLNANEGYSVRAAEWLDHQKKVSESLLDYLYTIAEEREEFPLALYVAKRRKLAYPDHEAEAQYALSLVRVGKIESGLQMINDLYHKNFSNPDIEEAYFNSLVEASKLNPKYSEQLRAFMGRKMRAPCLPEETLRDYAFAYLDVLYDKNAAEQILFALAQAGCATQDDLETLIDLWGPCVTEEQACFIVFFAQKSSLEHLNFWLVSLSAIQKYSDLMSIVRSRMGECWLGLEVYYTYLDALYHQRCYKEIREVIAYLLPVVFDLEQLEELSDYAGAIDDFEGRRMICEKAVALYPNHANVWQALADAAFDMEDDCAVARALNRFFSLYRQSNEPNRFLYISLYQYGVVLNRHLRYREALACYHQALTMIYESGVKNFQSVQYEALIAQQLRVSARALNKMTEFYELTSRDPQAAADFAQMMMDLGAWKSARHLIEETIGY